MMSELIRTVHTYPWTSFWVWIACLFTVILVAAQFRDNIFRIHLFLTHASDINLEKDDK